MKKYDRVKLKGDALADLNLTSNDEVVIVDFFEETTPNNNTPTKYAKVVDKDLNVHSVGLHEIITSDYGTKLKKVINILKDIEVCGEDMEHIIHEVGMGTQMLKQLSNKIGMPFVSHVDFNGDSFNRRFELIKDEVNEVLLLMANKHQDTWESEIKSHMSNIEIASDSLDDESLTWRLYKDA
jgi:hypothetical protein